MRPINYILSIFSFIGFLFFGFIFINLNIHISNKELLKTLLTSATFLFGLYIAFSISSRHTRLNEIKRLLKAESGALLSLYHASKQYSASAQNGMLTRIDAYLQEQIDYYLDDYNKSNNTFTELEGYYLNLKPKDKKQEILFNRLYNLVNIVRMNRGTIYMLIKDRMTAFEWFMIYILLTIIILSLFLLNDGALITLFITAMLAGAALIFTLLLRELDSLRWKEDTWVWIPLEALFEELDLLPYYPMSVIISGRARPQKGQKVRIARYPHPYPNMKDKEVEEVVF